MQLQEVKTTAEMKNVFDIRKLKAKVDEQDAELQRIRLQLAALNETVKRLITKLGPRS